MVLDRTSTACVVRGKRTRRYGTVTWMRTFLAEALIMSSPPDSDSDCSAADNRKRNNSTRMATVE
jgi:hypothetical protein